MGEVFVDYDEKLDRRVALKSIRAEHRFDTEAKIRFLREARVLSQLKHPNICQIFDYVEGAEGDQVKVLDFGLSRSQMEEGTLSLPPSRAVETAPVVTEVPDALATQARPGGSTAKPSSGPSGSSGGSVTSLGTIMGTLGYMSPEQARGEVATPASDLYSFGLVVQELFTVRLTVPPRTY